MAAASALSVASDLSACTAYDVASTATSSAPSPSASARALASVLKRARGVMKAFNDKQRPGIGRAGVAGALAAMTADVANHLTLHGFRLGFVTHRPTTETVVVGETGDGSGAWTAHILFKAAAACSDGSAGRAWSGKVTLAVWRGPVVWGTADVTVVFRPGSRPTPYWKRLSVDEARAVEALFPHA